MGLRTTLTWGFGLLTLLCGSGCEAPHARIDAGPETPGSMAGTLVPVEAKTVPRPTPVVDAPGPPWICVRP